MDSPAETVPRDFGLPPLLPGAWRALPEDLEHAFRQRLEGCGLLEDPRLVQMIRVLPLSFFPGWMLCDLLMGEVGPSADPELAALVVLYGRDGFTPLGEYRRIERHVELHGIDLGTEDRCAGFLTFAAMFGALGDAAPAIGSGEEAEQPRVAMRGADGAATPFDAVRAPEVARAEMPAIAQGERVVLSLRLAADGEITVLSRHALGPAPVAEAVRREGAMRFGPPPRREGAP